MTKKEELALDLARKREKIISEQLPGAFMNFIIGNGYWLCDKADGTYRNYLYISNVLGFTSEEVLIAHDIAVAASQGIYLNSASAKTLSGKLGAAGLLPMVAATPLFAGPATITVISSARAGLVISSLDALFSASIKPTPANLALHAMAGVTFGTLGFGVFKAGAFAYQEAAVPVGIAVIDCARFIGFNRHLQRELRIVGKELAYKHLSPLTHGIKYDKGQIHSAITGALGEANLGYVLEKVLIKNYGFTHMAAKYDTIHGFDGLFVKMAKDGSILQVVFAESKASSRAIVHGLSRDKDGVQQLSRAYIKKTLERLRQAEPLDALTQDVMAYLETEANWKNVTRMVAKTNGSGWTQWHEAVGGLVDNSNIVLRPLSDSYKLIQKNANTLTLKRRAAAGLLPGVAATNAYANPEYADESIDIVAPTHAQMRAELDDNFPHDPALQAQVARMKVTSHLPKAATPQFSNFVQPSWSMPLQKQPERPKAKGEHPPTLKGLWEGQGKPIPPVEPPAPPKVKWADQQRPPILRGLWEGQEPERAPTPPTPPPPVRVRPEPQIRWTHTGGYDMDAHRGHGNNEFIQYNYGDGWVNAPRIYHDTGWDNQGPGNGPSGGYSDTTGGGYDGGGYNGCGSMGWDGDGGMMASSCTHDGDNNFTCGKW